MYDTDMYPPGFVGAGSGARESGVLSDGHSDRRRLEELDLALGRLRRLWDQPGVRAWFRERLDIPELDAALYRTLRGVRQLGPEGASVNDVAEMLRIDPSTASRFVERAVASGFLSRSSSVLDRRRSTLLLTEAGTQRLMLLREARLEMWETLTVTWSTVDVVTLTSLLTRLDDAVIEFGLDSDVVPPSAAAN